LSGPPGISPLTFSSRAMEKIKNRKKPVANWYLDATLLAAYWCPPQGTPRKYHHTTPANLLYALREALILLYEEKLENAWKRHEDASKALYFALEELRVERFVQETKNRLPSLTSVRVPDGKDAKQIQKYLLDNYGIEIAGGLGDLAGKIWRVGLMGFNARISNVKLLKVALEEALKV